MPFRSIARQGTPGDYCSAEAFAAYLAPLRRRKWHVYCKAPFAGPEAVLAYLSRYTHRCRSSSQIAHCRGATLLGVYWVPHAVQMNGAISLLREDTPYATCYSLNPNRTRRAQARSWLNCSAAANDAWAETGIAPAAQLKCIFSSS